MGLVVAHNWWTAAWARDAQDASSSSAVSAQPTGLAEEVMAAARA